MKSGSPVILSILLLPVFLTACTATYDDDTYDVVIFRGDYGWIFGTSSFSSQDGGRTWSRLPFRSVTPPSGIAAEFRDRYDFVDARCGFQQIDGELKRTLDGGQTWERVPTPTQSVQAIAFRDRLHGVAASASSPARFTRDGHAWSEAKAPRNPTLDLVKYDRITGVASGMRGFDLFTSTNGGESWSKKATFENAILGMRWFGGKVWLVGANGICRFFNPHNNRISTYDALTTKVLVDIAVEGRNIAAISAEGSIFTSHNYGASWDEHAHPASPVFVSIDRAESGRWVAIGTTTTWLKGMKSIAIYSDDLATWHKLDLPPK